MKEELQKYIVNENASTFEVMRVIQENAAQIALIIKDEKLLGTISDGDIRRNVLKKGSLESKAKDIMRRNFKYISVEENISEAKKKMIFEKINQLPILDKKGTLIDLLQLNDLFRQERMPNHVVIMAGGKGKRLRPYTSNCPKPMIEVNGKPILEIILEQCIDNGFYNFHFSVNYLKEQIINYFKDGSKWNVSINYLKENKPLGTAGSLKLLPKQTQPIIVINGDLLTRLNLNRILEFHNENKGSATLGVRNYSETIPFGIVEIEGVKLRSFIEKPTYNYLVNAGVYILNPNLLSILDKEEYVDMPDLLKKAQSFNHLINVCPIHEYWLDIGKPEFLKKANKEWFNNE